MRADPAIHNERLFGIEALLRVGGYMISGVRKEFGTFVDLQPLERFPQKAWTHATAENCDYLLIAR